MIEKVLELVKKYKEMILYLIFGGLTTLINILVYELFSKAFDVQYLVSNGIAWVIAVLFAFVTNRLYVFESRSRDPKVIGRQFVSFIGARLFTGLLDMLLMYIFIDLVHWNDTLVKIGANVVVIVLNYIFSKLWNFRKAK